MISGNDNSAFLYTAVAQLSKEKIMGGINENREKKYRGTKQRFYKRSD